MLRKSAVALTLALDPGAGALDTETRQLYREQFSLTQFMYPSEQASWYWRNLEQVLPSARIKRAGPCRPLARALMDPARVHRAPFQGHTLGEWLHGDHPSINGLMILQGGKVVFEHYNMPANTQHVWMSNAKTLAGTLVALLELEGRIEVTRPLAHYLPELTDTAWGPIRVIDVLNMQSGIDAEENDAARADPDAAITRLFRTEFGEGGDYAQVLRGIPAKRPPGQAFEYSSANTQILGQLIARVEGRSLSEVIEARVWSRAGMSADASMTLTPDGYEAVHGLFSSNLEDMARYALLFTDSWAATADAPLIPKAVVETLQGSVTPGVYGVSEAAGPFLALTEDRPLGASYQFDAVWADGDLFKGGMRGQGIYLSPRRDAVAVWFSNRIEGGNVAGHIRNLMKTL
ncbi:serine hydrolase domain-containing protein [Ferrimonas balearica]|uniref:serine hydrolase domain-containing protein n=1 Tax=Ferrimonas balearica TaxID=44012 RepID=UPI001C990A2B|nr:serine hydrolase domain-containing protein [Ferrimonas balearica]MBY5993235.1 beta-lactamase family protein [Ferrimonas balearica]